MLASGLVTEDNDWVEADTVTFESVGIVDVDFSFLLLLILEASFLEDEESFELSFFFLTDFLEETETE